MRSSGARSGETSTTTPFSSMASFISWLLPRPARTGGAVSATATTTLGGVAMPTSEPACRGVCFASFAYLGGDSVSGGCFDLSVRICAARIS